MCTFQRHNPIFYNYCKGADIFGVEKKKDKQVRVPRSQADKVICTCSFALNE